MFFRLAFSLALCGCARLGTLEAGLGPVLLGDAASDPSCAADRPLAVEVSGTIIGDWEEGTYVILYRPATQSGPLPAVIFLPARSAPPSQYESYGRDLASRGFVVAVRGWYSFFRTDPELAGDARQILRWLTRQRLADPKRIGLAGHSMGGKASILAGLAEPDVRAVVAIDPDENGYTHVARGPIEGLRPPLLVLGMELAIKAIRLCATPEGSYRSFFPHAPPGTLELTLRGADHVQLMDRPDSLGMGICRVGTASSQRVRVLTRSAMVRFFEHHLLGRALALPSGPELGMRTKSAQLVHGGTPVTPRSTSRTD